MSDWRCERCLRKPPYVTRKATSPICTRCRETLTAKGKKWCRTCKRPLPLSRFAVVNKAGYRRAQCRRCRQPLATAAQRRWRQRYPVAARAITEAWRARNPERVKLYRHRTYRRRVARLWRTGRMHVQ